MISKKCNKCSVVQDITEYHRDKRNARDGRVSICKACSNASSRERYYNTIEYQKERAARYYKNNKERMDAKSLRWRVNNIERARELDNLWNKRNKAYCAFNAAKRRARKKSATPKWLTDFDWCSIKSLYTQASELGMHVDHIIPLVSDKVCGLHVPWNLQLLEPIENLKKGNSI